MLGILGTLAGRAIGGLVGNIFGKRGGSVLERDLQIKALPNEEPGPSNFFGLNAEDTCIPLGLREQQINVAVPFITSNDTTKYIRREPHSNFNPSGQIEFNLTSQGDALINLDTMRMGFRVKVFGQDRDTIATDDAKVFPPVTTKSVYILGDTNLYTATIDKTRLLIEGNILNEYNTGRQRPAFARATWNNPLNNINESSTRSIMEDSGAYPMCIHECPTWMTENGEQGVIGDDNEYPGNYAEAATSNVPEHLVEYNMPHDFFKRRKFLEPNVKLRLEFIIAQNPQLSCLAFYDRYTNGKTDNTQNTATPNMDTDCHRSSPRLQRINQTSQLVTAVIVDVFLRYELQRIDKHLLGLLYTPAHTGYKFNTSIHVDISSDYRRVILNNAELQTAMETGNLQEVQIVSDGYAGDYVFIDAYGLVRNYELISEGGSSNIGAVIAKSISRTTPSLWNSHHTNVVIGATENEIVLNGLGSWITVEEIKVNGTVYYLRTDLPPASTGNAQGRNVRMVNDRKEAAVQNFTASGMYEKGYQEMDRAYHDVLDRMEHSMTKVDTQFYTGAAFGTGSSTYTSAVGNKNMPHLEMRDALIEPSKSYPFIKLHKTGGMTLQNPPRTGQIELEYRITVPHGHFNPELTFTATVQPNNVLRAMYLSFGNIAFNQTFDPTSLETGLGVDGKTIQIEPWKDGFNYVIEFLSPRFQVVEYSRDRVESLFYVQTLLERQDGIR